MTICNEVKAALLALIVTTAYWSLPFLSDFLAGR